MIKTVYLHNTDSMGHVYYAEPLKWFEEVRMNLLSEVKPLTEWMKEDVVFMPRSVNVEYKRPIALLDDVWIHTTLEFGKVTITLHHECMVGDDLAIKGSVEMVMLKNGRPCRIPEELKEYANTM